jgi:hypothetical protein
MAKKKRTGLSRTPRDTGRKGAPLAEYERMSNGELAAVIREKLREAGGDAFDLLDVDVQDGRVFLRGEVPSQRQMHLGDKTVTDEMGFEVVDRMRVTQTLWKQGEDEPRQGIEPREGGRGARANSHGRVHRGRIRIH